MPFFVDVLARLPASLIHFTRQAWVLGLNDQGQVIHNLQDTTGLFSQATGAYPIGDAIYVTSNTEPALLCLPHPQATTDPCRPPHHRELVTSARNDVRSPESEPATDSSVVNASLEVVPTVSNPSDQVSP